MKLNEAITRLKVALNKGIPSNDGRYSSEYLYSQLKTMRAKRLRQKLDQFAFISNYTFSTIDCIPLVLGQFSDCPCFTSDCFILRSKYQIPQLISYRSGLYLKVFTISGKEISETSKIKENNKQYRKTQVNELGYFFHNNYLFIVGSTTLKTVMLTGIFVDPLELEEIPLCDPEGNPLNGTCFNPLTENFPIDEELYEDIEAMIIQKILTFEQSTTEDTENNDRPPNQNIQ